MSGVSQYRKGRCRFGHNCKFAHDSDLYCETPAETPEPELTTVCDTLSNTSAGAKGDRLDGSTEADVTKKKKRPGLSQGLVPGKKVMNMYKKQKLSNKKL
uniref:C3H1-type domain-containing protein n=1 Tax=Graphocephala atropunctata TaxID=36148 RepID=A0A1B6MD17_9HEMI